MRYRYLLSSVFLLLPVSACHESRSSGKPTSEQSTTATNAHPATRSEHTRSKGGMLERPSAARVNKFKLDAQRALQRYSQKLRLGIPRTQKLTGSTISAPKLGEAGRPASPTDQFFSWKPLIVFNTDEDQGQCGSCYIFAGVGALEESWAKQNPTKNIVASQQLVLNCVGSCKGGYISTVVEFLTNKGTVAAATNSYTGVPAGCTFNPPLPYRSVSGAYVAADGGKPTESALKAAILKYGPIPAFIYAGGTFDSWWGVKEPAVISDDSSGDENGHIVLITGWNDDPKVNAWEIKNSWGATWGDNGFGYVRKGVRDLGDNAMWLIALQ
jgi:C1A family cysteine protease